MSETPSYSADRVSLGRAVDSQKALNLGSQDFAQHKYEYYTYLREHLPRHSGGQWSLVQRNRRAKNQRNRQYRPPLKPLSIKHCIARH